MTNAASSATIREFVDRFIAFETDHDLFSLKIKGHRVWDYLRYDVWYTHFRRVLAFVPPPSGPHSRFQDLSPRRWISPQKPLRHQQYDVLVINYDRNRLFDGRRVNIQSYPFIKALPNPERALLLEPAPLTVDVSDNYPCDVLRTWRRDRIDRAAAELIRYSGREVGILEDIGTKLRRELDIQVDLPRMARQVFSYQLRLYAKFVRLLKRFQPKLLAYTDTASLKGAIEAAHSLGVPTGDIQHSLMSDVNILYQYGEVSRPVETLSDIIFTMGPYWDPAFRHPARKVPVGFPYFEAERARTRARGITTGGDRALIVLSDSTFSRSAFIRAALDLANRLPDVKIYYKLRPDEYETWRQFYPPEFQNHANLHVIDSDEVPLYDYFARCEWQVGINSTAMFEGLGFGLTTFVLKDGWYEEMVRLVNEGGAFLATGADDIVARIRAGDRPRAIPHVDSFFQPDSSAHIFSAVQEILRTAHA